MDPAQRQISLARIFGVVGAYSEDDDLFIISPDRIGFGIITSPLTGFDQARFDNLNALLNLHFPAGTLLQFSMYASPDIERMLHDFKVMRHDTNNPLLKAMSEKRVDFLRELTMRPAGTAMGARVRQVRVVITVQLPNGPEPPTREKILEVNELRSTFVSTLKSIGLRGETLTAKGYIRFMEAVLNHDRGALWRKTAWEAHDDTNLICNQLLDADTDIRVGRKGLELGDAAMVRTLSVKRYPDYIHPGMAGRYLGDLMKGQKAMRDPVLITVNIIYPDHESKRSSLTRDLAWTTKQVEGQLSKYVPAFAQKLTSLRAANDAVETGDRLIYAYVGFAVFGENEDRVIAASTEVQAMMRELGFQTMEDRHFVLPLFAQLLPFGAEEDMKAAANRYRTMATRHVVPMLPVLGSWKGTGTPLLTLIARDGNVMCTSPQDTSGNMNVVIAAQSGMGKSFLANEVVTSFLQIGGRAWIIDKGFSYKPLAEMIDGTYIEFTQEANICMNPFTIVKSFEDESDLLSSLIEVMAAPKHGLDDFQSAGVKRVLSECWERLGRKLMIDDLAEAFKAEVDVRLVDLGHQLFPWTTKGDYGRFFNGENNVNLDNALVVLELQQLSGRTHLQRLVLLMVMYQIQQAMDALPVQMPKVLLIDEAFALLASNETKNFIITWYRQLRKFGASAIVATQSVNDFFADEGSAAILENSEHMWLLGQKAESIAMVKKEQRMPLPESAFKLLESVHTVPGEYSEIMVRNSAGIGVGRLVVSEFNKLLYSTAPKDKAARKSYMDRGMSLVDAINQMIRDRSTAPKS